MMICKADFEELFPHVFTGKHATTRSRTSDGAAIVRADTPAVLRAGMTSTLVDLDAHRRMMGAPVEHASRDQRG